VSILLSVFLLLLTVGALVTVITADEGTVRHLPKLVWVLLIVFLPLVGSIVWFAVGKDWSGSAREPVSFGDPRREEAARLREPTRSTPEDDEAAIEAEIRYHEKQAEIRRLEAEVARKREQEAGG
jgi:hypothetical protein